MKSTQRIQRVRRSLELFASFLFYVYTSFVFHIQSFVRIKIGMSRRPANDQSLSKCLIYCVTNRSRCDPVVQYKLKGKDLSRLNQQEIVSMPCFSVRSLTDSQKVCLRRCMIKEHGRRLCFPSRLGRCNL